MAYAKTVIIGVKGLSLTVMGVTKANIGEELDSDVVPTFDDPVSVPSSDGGYSVDIDALEARNVDEFKTLKKILMLMKTEAGEITIKETIKHKTGNFDDENYLSGVRLTSNKVEYSPKDLTARNLSFKAESLKELVDGEEIKVDDYLD